MFLLFFFLALCYSCTTFFLIRHIYKLYTPKRKDSYHCDRKLFLLYVVNSRLKKFFCCLLQGIILSSQIIYIPHIVLFSCCNMSMTFVVAPNTSGLTPVYPYESSPSQKSYPKSLKNQTPQKRLSRNRTAKVIPFYYTTKLFANFF